MSGGTTHRVTVYTDGSFVVTPPRATAGTPGIFVVPAQGNSMQPPNVTVTHSTQAPQPVVHHVGNASQPVVHHVGNASGWVFNPPAQVWGQQTAGHPAGNKPDWNLAGADAQATPGTAVWKFNGN
jgi:hypothetical protein